MAVTDSYADFVLEQLAPLRGVTGARFFGGFGLSQGGALFGMVMNSAFYLAVDDTTRPRYIAMGSNCFSYSTKKGRVDVTRFYAVPAHLLEDQEALVELAKEAVRVAVAGKERRAKAPAAKVNTAKPGVSRKISRTRAPGSKTGVMAKQQVSSQPRAANKSRRAAKVRVMAKS